MRDGLRLLAAIILAITLIVSVQTADILHNYTGILK